MPSSTSGIAMISRMICHGRNSPTIGTTTCIVEAIPISVPPSNSASAAP